MVVADKERLVHVDRVGDGLAEAVSGENHDDGFGLEEIVCPVLYKAWMQDVFFRKCWMDENVKDRKQTIQKLDLYTCFPSWICPFPL